jgi:hypothetical protein
MVNFGMTALKSKMDSMPYKRFPEKCVTVRTDPSWDREGVSVLLARCPKTSHFCRLQIIDSTEFRIAAIGRSESSDCGPLRKMTADCLEILRRP